MARPAKKGLDYYPADTNRRNDFKIMDLLNEYGPLGYTIYDFCLQYIYESGYFLDVPLKQVCLTLCRDIGAKWIKNKDLVWQVIDYCADIGLFDKDLLRQNVMTSVGIQRRYDSVTVRNKVDKSKFWLLEKQKLKVALINAPKNGVSATETQVNATEMQVNATEMQQIKENKSKENKSKENIKQTTFISLRLKNGFYNIPFSILDEYKKSYPSVDVETELLKISKYFEINSEKRKTSQEISLYINKWLKARSEKNINAQGRTNTTKFNHKTGEIVL